MSDEATEPAEVADEADFNVPPEILNQLANAVGSSVIAVVSGHWPSATGILSFALASTLAQGIIAAGANASDEDIEQYLLGIKPVVLAVLAQLRAEDAATPAN